MNASSWLTVLMVLLVLLVMFVLVGLAQEAMGGINESGIIERGTR
ncbi:hypothetical protein LCGC14_1011020 [marine sediment metagenome]|uniref:Uncharacterized protein n=1 Tax=marine sediment metagenome TaxID=412755 RepID=A0A0F9N0D0_9ZZZZ